MNKKAKINKIHKYNSKRYDILKAIEEMAELSAALTQSLTKSQIKSNDDIIEEFGDVKFRLAVLEKHYDSNKIKKRSELKLNKSVAYLETKKYKNV